MPLEEIEKLFLENDIVKYCKENDVLLKEEEIFDAMNDLIEKQSPDHKKNLKAIWLIIIGEAIVRRKLNDPIILKYLVKIRDQFTHVDYEYFDQYYNLLSLVRLFAVYLAVEEYTLTRCHFDEKGQLVTEAYSKDAINIVASGGEMLLDNDDMFLPPVCIGIYQFLFHLLKNVKITQKGG